MEEEQKIKEEESIEFVPFNIRNIIKFLGFSLIIALVFVIFFVIIAFIYTGTKISDISISSISFGWPLEWFRISEGSGVNNLVIDVYNWWKFIFDYFLYASICLSIFLGFDIILNPKKY